MQKLLKSIARNGTNREDEPIEELSISTYRVSSTVVLGELAILKVVPNPQ